jgi:transposase
VILVAPHQENHHGRTREQGRSPSLCRGTRRAGAWPDERIAQALDINRMTVSRARAQFAAEGLDATLHKQKAKDRQYRKLDGQQEARLIALACSQPPEGQARWTMKLLADKLVELEVVPGIDPSTVWRALQKTNSSRG